MQWKHRERWCEQFGCQHVLPPCSKEASRVHRFLIIAFPAYFLFFFVVVEVDVMDISLFVLLMYMFSLLLMFELLDVFFSLSSFS